MIKLLKALKRFYLPRRLPTGMGEFNAWISDIVLLSGLPDNASTRHLAATFILHTNPSTNYLSVWHISRQLCKAAAYQVAREVAKDTDPKKVTNEQTQFTAAPTEV